MLSLAAVEAYAGFLQNLINVFQIMMVTLIMKDGI